MLRKFYRHPSFINQPIKGFNQVGTLWRKTFLTIVVHRQIRKLTRPRVVLLRSHPRFRSLASCHLPTVANLKGQSRSSDHGHLIKFLENNGKNLNEIYLRNTNNSLNLTIARSCPKLKTLCTIFLLGEMETLKVIFDHCQQLESVKVWCGGRCVDEEEILDAVVKSSPQTFRRLKIYHREKSRLPSEKLESFLLSWKERNPQKLLNLIIINKEFANEENDAILEKYQKLGIVKVFVERYDTEVHLFD